MKLNVQAVELTWSQCDGHVGKQTHAECCQRRNSSRCSDEIPIDLLNTEEVCWITVAKVRAIWRADTGTSSLRDNSGIDRDDICHSKECRQTSSDLSEEVGTLSLSQLYICQSRLLKQDQHWPLTAPDPSRRKYLPTKLRATAALVLCIQPIARLMFNVCLLNLPVSKRYQDVVRGHLCHIHVESSS